MMCQYNRVLNCSQWQTYYKLGQLKKRLGLAVTAFCQFREVQMSGSPSLLSTWARGFCCWLYIYLAVCVHTFRCIVHL